jgi:hypothetical protein
MKPIYVIGDSHALRFKDKSFITKEIVYATAHNLIENDSTSKGREKTLEYLETIDKTSKIVLAFGEIDCRSHILKHNDDAFEGVVDTVDRYFQFILEVWKKGWKNLIIFAPVTSTPWTFELGEFPTEGSVRDRNHVTYMFGKYLEDKCNKHGLMFVSIFDDLLLKQFEPNPDFYQNDHIHIKPEIQVELFKNNYRDKLVPFKYGGRNRKVSFNKVLNHLDGIDSPVLVEIGQTRNYYNWNGDGYSTPLFIWYMNQRLDGHFYSIDISDNSEVYKAIFGIWGLRDGQEKGATILQEDGIKFLKEFEHKIDFLYLDAWDYHKTNIQMQTTSETMHLEAFKIVEPKLNKGAYILIDDILDQETYVGKGKLLIPYMLDNGYELIHKGYQFLFKKVK